MTTAMMMERMGMTGMGMGPIAMAVRGLAAEPEAVPVQKR